MELTVYQQDGTEAGRTVTLEPSVFDIDPNDHVIWLDVRRIQAHQRQGTHKTKERSEVRGSGRKLYRQKGTGNARAGDAKSPIRKTGGRTHGARPRDYRLQINKKTRRLARRSALSYKARAEALRVVENFSLEAPSTRALSDLIESLGVDGQKVLILTADNEQEVYLSARNLPKVSVAEGRNANTVELLDADVLVVQEGALEQMTDILKRAEPAPAA